MLQEGVSPSCSIQSSWWLGPAAPAVWWFRRTGPATPRCGRWWRPPWARFGRSYLVVNSGGGTRAVPAPDLECVGDQEFGRAVRGRLPGLLTDARARPSRRGSAMAVATLGTSARSPGDRPWRLADLLRQQGGGDGLTRAMAHSQAREVRCHTEMTAADKETHPNSRI